MDDASQRGAAVVVASDSKIQVYAHAVVPPVAGGKISVVGDVGVEGVFHKDMVHVVVMPRHVRAALAYAKAHVDGQIVA